MAKHRLIDCRAPGYWGGDPRITISANLIPDKVLSQNLDKILAMGLPHALWREASMMRDGLSRCSCFKDTSKQPDIPCLSCYGTGYIPGYFKFGTRNYWIASADPGWTLTNVVRDTTNRPNRLMLAPAATTGMAVSPNLAITVAGKLAPWESNADGFTRDNGVNSSITVEASKDGGSTWFALSALEAQSPTTQLRFRVIFSRTAVTVKTPMFEIVRARFATILDISNRISEPVIRIIPTWLNEAEHRESSGTKMEARGNRFWTMPMAFFDSSLAIDEPRSRIMDDAFIEVKYGGENGYRYATVDFSYSDTYGVFTRQECTLRKVTGAPGRMDGEHYYRIW